MILGEFITRYKSSGLFSLLRDGGRLVSAVNVWVAALVFLAMSWAGNTHLVFAEAAFHPVIGEERVHVSPKEHNAIAALKNDEIIALGRKLFTAKFTKLDGAGRPGATQSEIPTRRDAGDAPPFFRTSGPEANACNGCHNQPNLGGSGEFVANVFTSGGVSDPDFDSLDPQFSNERGTPALNGSGLVELLAREMTRDLQKLRDEAAALSRVKLRPVFVSLVSKGVSFGKMALYPSGHVDIDGIKGVDHDLVVRPFGQKGVFTSLRQFTINALNSHHGMQASERFGARWTGSSDFDGDGHADEILPGDVTALVAFQASLAMPSQKFSTHPTLKIAAEEGEKLFNQIGCVGCHKTSLPLENIEFVEPGPYNAAGNLRASPDVKSVRISLKNLGLKKDAQGRWLVPLFSDLKRHRIADAQNEYFANELLGQRFVARDVFLTPRLWGVGSTAPYGHRGDITTLRKTILFHGGEAAEVRGKFAALKELEQAKIVEFLLSLKISAEGVQ